MTTNEATDDNMWHGVPMKRYGETYGQYTRRITPEQEFQISRAARFIGVMPRSIFDSYIQMEPDTERGTRTAGDGE